MTETRRTSRTAGDNLDKLQARLSELEAEMRRVRERIAELTPPALKDFGSKIHSFRLQDIGEGQHLTEQLQEAVKRCVGTSASRCGSAYLTEEFGGIPVWRGVVDTYDSARGKAYAWIAGTTGEIIVALHQPPIDSPQLAVRAWLASRRENADQR